MEGNGIGQREKLGCGTATRKVSLGATGSIKPACRSCELWWGSWDTAFVRTLCWSIIRYALPGKRTCPWELKLMFPWLLARSDLSPVLWIEENFPCCQSARWGKNQGIFSCGYGSAFQTVHIGALVIFLSRPAWTGTFVKYTKNKLLKKLNKKGIHLTHKLKFIIIRFTRHKIAGHFQ